MRAVPEKLSGDRCAEKRLDMNTELENNMQELMDKVVRCEEEIGKAIVGQRDVIRQIMLAVLADGNVLLEGVPGLGKTQLIKTMATVMDLSFSRIQFTPDLMPADVTGTNLIVKEDNKNVFTFSKGPVFANMVLADEINRATPKTQSAMLEAMQEKNVTVGKETYALPQPFMVLATQNPIENEGTYPLPEAQLDRFLFKLLIEFPSLKELKEIMDITVTGKKVELNTIITGEDLLKLRSYVQKVPMAEAVERYALRLVVGTHRDSEEATDEIRKYVSEGASPRGAQAIFLAAKARAILNGRMNVSFEDIDFVAVPALRHRLVLNFEALSDGVSPDAIVRSLMEEKKKDR